MGTGTLILTRPRQWADRLRRYRILVDGREVARLKAGEELRLELPAGEHRMIAQIDWCTSNLLPFGIRPNETTEIEVGASARGWSLLASAFFITMGSGHYLYLKHRVVGFPVREADRAIS